jgi:hypothetical protein
MNYGDGEVCGSAGAKRSGCYPTVLLPVGVFNITVEIAVEKQD